ncbi:MAG: MFS transporter [Candidatus Dormibacteria bacterium]
MSTQLWRNRDFLTAVLARAGSLVGDEVALVVLTLRIEAEGGHPWQIALLLAVGLVPVIVLARLAGRVVDSSGSRRILLIASVAQTAACAPLILTQNFELMLVLVALIAVGSAFTGPTWSALTPAIVGEDQIGRATAASQTVFALGGMAAPAAAGLLTGAFGTRLPLGLDAASFALMALGVVLIRTRRHVAPGAAGSSARGGWKLLRQDRLVGTLVLGLSVFVFLGMMVNVVEVFLVRVTLHASTAWYGGAESVWTAGLVAGSVLAGQVGHDLGRAQATVAGAAMISVALLAFSVVPNVVWLLPAGLFGGVGNGLVNVCVGTLITTRTPQQVRGRVFAALGAAVSTATVLSLVLGAVVAGLVGPRLVYLAAGACCLATAGLLAAQLSRTCRVALPPDELGATEAGVAPASPGTATTASPVTVRPPTSDPDPAGAVESGSEMVA